MIPTNKILLATFLLIFPLMVNAQKGTGNDSGIARSNSTVDIKTISGKIQKIITEPCTETTGRYSTGVHILIKPGNSENNIINVHLGPAAEISHITEQLNVGQNIKLSVFRTNDLKENHYIIKELSTENETFELRDANLQPFWANSNRRRGRGRW